MEETYDGILEDWDYINGRLYGTIYYDSKGRFNDGDLISTSVVLSNEDYIYPGGFVNTKNSTYRLGVQFVN